jgi:branched-chain amino acid transport system permease protein
MPGLEFRPLFGLFEFDVLYFRTQYLYALAALLAGFLLVRMLVYSSFGRSLTGIRENLLRMHAIGAPVRARQVLVYAISAALAGVAGGLFTQANGFVNLAVLGLDRSAGVLIILILGGHGRLYGAFAGAIAYLVLEHTLAKAYPSAWQLGIGLTLVLVALYARNGILGFADALRRRRSSR